MYVYVCVRVRAVLNVNVLNLTVNDAIITQLISKDEN